VCELVFEVHTYSCDSVLAWGISRSLERLGGVNTWESLQVRRKGKLRVEGNYHSLDNGTLGRLCRWAGGLTLHHHTLHLRNSTRLVTSCLGILYHPSLELLPLAATTTTTLISKKKSQQLPTRYLKNGLTKESCTADARAKTVASNSTAHNSVIPETGINLITSTRYHHVFKLVRRDGSSIEWENFYILEE